ncbi:DUF3304 domain-containing protein [Cupriavidus pauculus]|uniref:DUF3304 domain-containing protein n=1 Tax=Cupriavidus pauculus TaxID=82633 RepID=UPI001245C379|nr:DUF3304 domain-containing protein [Cupriavidus pauculus]KAB0599927.1 DUF3304 domain-containing protein [Cupriavidus pauculus]MCM3604704.1 DUF3304 domain-containing protein [Cupriavidus pauculus]UAK98745.1 DUF3304 domain-containing protein [Cupriavidus pauculus]
MRRFIKTIAVAVWLVLLGGCASGQPRGWVEAAGWAANYTEDFIYDFSILTADGKRTGVSGTQVSEFSRRGTSGGHICCGLMPGVGQTVKVVWRVGGRREDESQWRTYSRDVLVSGTMPKETKTHNYVLVRFFPRHEVEVELVPSVDLDPRNPRVDKLFSGQRVMRKKGE